MIHHCEVARFPSIGSPHGEPADSCPKERYENIPRKVASQGVPNRGGRDLPAGRRGPGAGQTMFHIACKLLLRRRGGKPLLVALGVGSGLRAGVRRVRAHGNLRTVNRWIGRGHASPGSSSPNRHRCGAVLVLLCGIAAPPAATASLQSRILAADRSVGASLIVGRAQCADGVWLLNESRQLIQIALDRKISIRPVRGLTAEDQPWGLACLAGRTLWTLANPRTLARVAQDGAVVERLPLQVPRIALFGIGDYLLFAPAPPMPASSALAFGPPHRLQEARPWPGLISQAASTRAELFTKNLVTCGLTTSSAVPCWFAEDTQVVMSDGPRVDRYAFPSIRAADVDGAAPLRDVALVGADRVWLLPTSLRRHDGRHAADRIILATTAGREISRLTLDSPVRLMLAATRSSCLLLTVRGELMEVVGP